MGDYPSSLAAVAAVTRAYGWACATALDAELGPSAYDGWLAAHGDAFSAVGAAAERALDGACDDAEAARPAYVAALSALYNYVDAEASTAGLKGSGAALEDARRRIDAVEPGFLAAHRAAKGCEIPNFKGSFLGRFPLVSADFWTSDHLSERPRSVDAFLERARAKHSR